MTTIIMTKVHLRTNRLHIPITPKHIIRIIRMLERREAPVRLHRVRTLGLIGFVDAEEKEISNQVLEAALEHAEPLSKVTEPPLITDY